VAFVQSIIDIVLTVGIIAVTAAIIVVPAYIAYRLLRYIFQYEIPLKIAGGVILVTGICLMIYSLCGPNHYSNYVGVKAFLLFQAMGITAITLSGSGKSEGKS